MRTDVSPILQSLGFIPIVDFIAVQDSPSNVTVTWLSGTTMPTVAAINAAAPTAAATIATKTAQAAKASATNSIDYGALQRGTVAERLIVALALVVLDEVNVHSTFEAALLAAFAAATSLADLQTRVAAVVPVPQRTSAQLVAAVKAKIAATGE